MTKKPKYYILRVLTYPIAWTIMVVASTMYSALNKEEIGYNLYRDLGFLKHTWFLADDNEES